MNTRHLFKVLVLALIFFHLQYPAYAANKEVDPGQKTFREGMFTADFEKIDPYSGSLTLIHNDLSLPGNGGLDLNIYRIYQSGRVDYYNNIAPGWVSHFGRISFHNRSVSIELQDGTTSTAVSTDPNDWTNTHTYLTKDFWKIDSTGTPTLFLTDGTKIIFGHGEYDDWHYATEIQKNGNSIKIHYPGSSPRISYLEDSVGRTIQYHYSANDGKLVSITYDGKSINYDYSASTSTFKVTLPDQETWNYEYDQFSFPDVTTTSYKIKQITTPTGGIITYNYDSFIRWQAFQGQYSNKRFQISVSSKTISGTGITPGTWTYQYGANDDKNLDYTVIFEPCDRTTVYYFYGYSGGYDDDNNQNECYRYGLVHHKFTIDGHHNPATPSGFSYDLDEATVYKWDKLPTPLSVSVEYGITLSELPALSYACHDWKTFTPVLEEQTVYRGGTVWDANNLTSWRVTGADDEYTTKYADFDSYGNPGTTEEYGSGVNSNTVIRETTQDYFYNTILNIIKSKPTSVRIKGGGPLFQAPNFSFTSHYSYNPDGLLLSEDSFGAAPMTYTYDSDGNLETITDANNHTTTYEWQYGTVSAIHKPDNLYSISRSINPDGTIASETNGEHKTTYYEYTPGMRIKKITPPLGYSTDYTYQFGTVARTDKKRGNYKTVTFFNGLGQERAVWDQILGYTAIDTYTACGRLLRKSSETGDTVQYDHFGRIERVTHQDQSRIDYTYDSDNHVTIKDEEGHDTDQYYLSFGAPGEKWLSKVVDANRTTTSYTYNVAGSLLKSDMSFGPTREFTYNSNNQLTSEDQPESATINYSYDAAGNLKSKKIGFVTTNYGYDVINRLKYKYISVNDIQRFFYDKVDNLIKMTSPDGQVVYDYDAANRVKKATTTTLNKTKSLAYTYDNSDNLKTILYPSRKKVTYTYNSLNQVTAIGGFGSTVSPISYYTSGTARGLLKSYKFGNGKTTTFSYNERRAMTKTQATGISWLKFAYDDDRGNMTSVVNVLDNKKNKTFAYDYLNRLTTFDNQGGWKDGSFAYDNDGDRTDKDRTGTHDIDYLYMSNRMTTARMGIAGSIDYGYSLAGDMTKAGIYTYGYTPFHRLKWVKKNNHPVAEFGYDAKGNRLYKKAGSVTEIYLRGPDNNTYADLFPTGRSKEEYVYLNGTVIARFGKKIGIGPGPVTETLALPWLMLLLNDNENN